MAKCDPSKCEGTEQLLEPAASIPEQRVEQDKLLVLKQEEVDISDEGASKLEELDEMVFVAVKEESTEEYHGVVSNDQADDTSMDISTEDYTEQGTSVDNARELLTTLVTGKNNTVTLNKKKKVKVSIHICSVCGYTAGKSSNLTTHMMIQRSEQPFQCQECSFKCRQSGDLKRHMLVHSGELPYHCKECTYKCSRAGSLKKHLLIHSNEKPFQCQECSYKCRELCNLNKHMLIHTGEQPFECDKCSYKCRQSGSLKTHIFTHHTGKLTVNYQ